MEEIMESNETKISSSRYNDRNNFCNLHPQHLADLKKSGLTDETIHSAGIYSVPPADIPKLLRWNPNKVKSAMAFPYPGTDFVRLKVFPTYKDAEGHSVKYLQPKNSEVYLYLLPVVQNILLDMDAPLYVVEGEKKAAALVQAGKMAVGLGGIWNWCQKGTCELIQDWNKIKLSKRIINLVPDSDAWHNDHVLLAVYRLAKALTQHKAVISIVQLPNLPDAGKTGADDFLMVKGAQAFHRLCGDAITVEHKSFRVIRSGEEARNQEESGQTPLELIPEELKGRRIHPSIHFESDWASVGITLMKGSFPQFCIVTSDRKIYELSRVSSILSEIPQSYEGLANKWHNEYLQDFLKNARKVTLAEIANLIIDKLRKLVELKQTEEYTLITVWCIATYFYQLFTTFPRLNLIAEKGSGKSKVQGFLSETCFNGLLRVKPTPAVLFRLISPFRPTLCLDEMEGLSTEDRREILSIINAGYKKGAAVDRVEGEDREIKSFPVYAPMSLAGIKELNNITEDRAIVIVMEKGADRNRLNSEIDPNDCDWAKVRSMGYQLALTYFREVANQCRTMDVPAWLMARELELWRPLLTIAGLIDGQTEAGCVDDLLKLAKAQLEERSSFSPDAEALLSVLEIKIGPQEEISILPGELCPGLERALNRKHITPHFVGALLRRLGVKREDRGRLGSMSGSIYKIQRSWLKEIRTKYTPNNDCDIATTPDCNALTETKIKA